MSRPEALRAVVAATMRLSPMITRHVITAAHSPKPEGYRAHSLDQAIRHTETLLNELKLQQTRLGWKREDLAS